jgi:uncharacterized protein YbaA (DUF1428 family)
MAKYVDGFQVPVPKQKLDAYRRMTAEAGMVRGDFSQFVVV